MRVKSIKNVDAFFKALDLCNGRVELITDEKDVLNLASKLTQFIGLTRIFSNPEIDSYEIVCYDINDYEIIKEFLVPVES
ncbi:MAG: polya polymerase [Lachnospiraceae bacterium]|nr:polya polymerase [Lachnospiraceae bacterium]